MNVPPLESQRERLSFPTCGKTVLRINDHRDDAELLQADADSFHFIFYLLPRGDNVSVNSSISWNVRAPVREDQKNDALCPLSRGALTYFEGAQQPARQRSRPADG